MLNALSYPEIKFPAGFAWGTSTAAHQIEGGDIHSWNNYCEERDHYAEKSGAACDHWNRYKADTDLMKQLGYPYYRMSLSWARIEPEAHRFDADAIAHYLAELEYLNQRGIKVFLTLFHGSAPVWFEQAGGFLKRDNVNFFAEYVRQIVPRIKDLVDSFHVINEFNLSGGKDLAELALLHKHYLLAHAAGYHIIKEFTAAPVSTAHALLAPTAEHPHDQGDVLTASLVDWLRNEFFFHAIRTGEIVSPFSDAETVPEVKGALDYWAVNYYCRTIISSRRAEPVPPSKAERLKMIDRDFYMENIHPAGLVSNLVRLADKPVYITENGVSADDDRWRILKLATDLAAAAEAIEKGVDVRGYFHWSLMDNYEWTSFVPRFGLIDVDFKTQRRTPRPSAHFYGEIIRNNGFSGELVRKYLPEMPVLKLYN